MSSTLNLHGWFKLQPSMCQKVKLQLPDDDPSTLQLDYHASLIIKLCEMAEPHQISECRLSRKQAAVA